MLLATGCTPAADSGPVTRSSLEALEEGRSKVAAGDFAGARDAFAAAATAGGLQPDFYCEARLRQADCEARLGNFAAALTLLEELSANAPDTAAVNTLRTTIKARQSAGRDQAAPERDASAAGP